MRLPLFWMNRRPALPSAESARAPQHTVRLAQVALNGAGAWLLAHGEYESTVSARHIASGIELCEASELAIGVWVDRHVRDQTQPVSVSNEPLFLLARTSDGELVCRAVIAIPIRTTGFHGTLCVLDVVAREWSADDHAALRGCAENFADILHGRELRARADYDDSVLADREFLSAVLENVGEGIVACDAEGRLTVFNRATREFHGVGRDAIAAERWTEHYSLYRADGRTPLATYDIPLVRALAGQSVDEEEIVVAPHGLPSRRLICTGRAMHTADGTLLGAVVAMRDVTIERRVTTERDRVIAVIERTPDFVGQTTPDGKIQYLNAAARAMLGLGDIIVNADVDARSLHPPDILARLEREAIPVAIREGSWAGESVLRLPDRRDVPVWQIIIPHFDADGGVAYLSTVMRDLSEAKHAERALRNAVERAERANRAKSEFLSRASHELRTPLNSVIGFANILRRNKRDALSEQELVYVDRIASNGAHLLGLVNDILDLSKIEAGRVTLELAPVSLFDLFHYVAEVLSPRAAQFGLEFKVELPASIGRGDFTIITDEQRMRQVLLNLAGNAVKYTQRGRITLRLTASDLGVPAAIEIEDTGPGIPQEQLFSIFDAFSTGDAEARGDSAMGLGLAITKALCAQMGYELGVASIPGKGSVFTVGLRAGNVARLTPPLGISVVLPDTPPG